MLNHTHQNVPLVVVSLEILFLKNEQQFLKQDHLTLHPSLAHLASAL